jgi:hypothetical protein
MTPQQFDRACYELGLHELPQELQDAWRELAIGTLRAIKTEKLPQKSRADKSPIDSVRELLCHALDASAGAYENCALNEIDLGVPAGHRYSSVNTRGNWHGYVSASRMVHAIAADKSNRICAGQKEEVE